MNWIELHLQVSDQLVEQTEDLLLGLGALSVTLTDNANEPILEPDLGTQPVWSRTLVTGLFESTVDTELLLSLLRQQLPEDRAPAEWRHLDERVWEREWLKHFKPLQVAENFWVNTEPLNIKGATTLLLDPGLAFGTGTHPTTALCLEWLAAQDFAGEDVIDFGCGSGILAIAALLRNAEKAWCLDIDPQALTATKNNMQRNGIPDAQYEIMESLDDLIEPSSVLIANILAGPLMNFAEAISKQLFPQGRLCLSGILQEQAQSVCDAYSPYFDDLSVTESGDWVRINGIRKVD
jgi:ribosomal protein L11 methyltransferase